MLVIEALATGQLQVVPIGIFAMTALVSAALAVRVFGALGQASATASPIGTLAEPSAA